MSGGFNDDENQTSWFDETLPGARRRGGCNGHETRKSGSFLFQFGVYIPFSIMMALALLTGDHTFVSITPRVG